LFALTRECCGWSVRCDMQPERSSPRRQFLSGEERKPETRNQKPENQKPEEAVLVLRSGFWFLGSVSGFWFRFLISDISDLCFLLSSLRVQPAADVHHRPGDVARLFGSKEDGR